MKSQAKPRFIVMTSKLRRAIEIAVSPTAIGFAIALFTISQKFLYPYTGIILAYYKFIAADRSVKTLDCKYHAMYECALVGVGFCLLASRNGVSDLATGLINTEGEFISHLTRAILYIALPMVLLILIQNSARQVFPQLVEGAIAGIHTKILLCYSLTEKITGLPVRKGFIIDFPTLKPDVSNWVGSSCIVASALMWLLYAAYQNPQQKNKRTLLILSFNIILCLFYSSIFDNLSCTISVAILALLASSLLYKLRATWGSNIRLFRHLRRNNPRKFSVIASVAFLLTFGWINHNKFMWVVERLRLQHLFSRNDRVEFLLQGFKRFFAHNPSSSYIIVGPTTFQRPICFGTSETFLANTSACHNYWHILPWDAFRNAGYAGLSVSLIVLTILCKELILSVKLRSTATAIGITCVLYLCFSRPIVEAGSGEILPAIILATLCFLKNHEQQESLSIA
jgi:hypothetical protein